MELPTVATIRGDTGLMLPAPKKRGVTSRALMRDDNGAIAERLAVAGETVAGNLRGPTGLRDAVGRGGVFRVDPARVTGASR